MIFYTFFLCPLYLFLGRKFCPYPVQWHGRLFSLYCLKSFVKFKWLRWIRNISDITNFHLFRPIFKTTDAWHWSTFVQIFWVDDIELLLLKYLTEMVFIYENVKKQFVIKFYVIGINWYVCCNLKNGTDNWDTRSYFKKNN